MSSTSTLALNVAAIAKEINNFNKNLILIYAFNGTGKTRLSVAFKDLTKANNKGNHAGVYYNAYSEDLFYWDNDEEKGGENIRLMLQKSTLNQYHSLLDENNLREKLSLYKPKYDFDLNFYKNVADGIESISFFIKTEDKKASSASPIKISRGEEQNFIWSFFLSLFEVEALGDKQSGHFFIDDPVSSLDDHNIFITAVSLMDLIDKHFINRKIIITTHHVGFFSILADWLKKGEKSSSYKNHLKMNILKRDGNSLHLSGHDKDVFLYHLELLQTVKNAIEQKKLYAYHFALLRQILENVGSFLGVGRISYVLENIGFTDSDEVARIVNILSHKNVFRYEAKEMVEDNVRLFTDIYSRIMEKYNFRIH